MWLGCHREWAQRHSVPKSCGLWHARRPYPWHSIEGQMRQLADLAFLLRQYAFAEATYRLAAQVGRHPRVGLLAPSGSAPRPCGAECWYATWLFGGIRTNKPSVLYRPLQDYQADGNSRWYAGAEVRSRARPGRVLPCPESPVCVEPGCLHPDVPRVASRAQAPLRRSAPLLPRALARWLAGDDRAVRRVGRTRGPHRRHAAGLRPHEVLPARLRELRQAARGRRPGARPGERGLRPLGPVVATVMMTDLSAASRHAACPRPRAPAPQPAPGTPQPGAPGPPPPTAASKLGRMLAARVVLLGAAVQCGAGRYRAASEALMRAQSEDENARAGLLLEQVRSGPAGGHEGGGSLVKGLTGTRGNSARVWLARRAVPRRAHSKATVGSRLMSKARHAPACPLPPPQSAYCMLYARPPLMRKFAFQMVLAGIRYICCGQKRIAIHAYRQARLRSLPPTPTHELLLPSP
jgi:hypothetical protein